MLCDWTTYNPTTDSITRDIVYSQDVSETLVIYSNPNHAFYYISAQQDDEAWIMVQSDSTCGKGVPHTAFPIQEETSSLSDRESIEVRAMVYYKD